MHTRQMNLRPARASLSLYKRCNRRFFNQVWVPQFLKQVGSIEAISSDPEIRGVSRDRYWMSPILREELSDKFCDVYLLPSSIKELKRIVSVACEMMIPILCRGGGSGMRGQSVPLGGGIIVSTKWLKPQFYLDSHEGVLTCSAGHAVFDACESTKLKGWDLRVIPSNCHQTSTVGGLVSSRSFGMGSLQFGPIDEPGNVSGLTILTIEKEPQLIKISDGQTISGVLGACGTNCIITEVTLPLVPSQNWNDFFISFPSPHLALQFCDSITRSPVLVCREVAFFDSPLCQTLGAPVESIPPAHCVVGVTVSQNGSNHLKTVVGNHGGFMLWIGSNSDAYLSSLCGHGATHSFLRDRKSSTASHWTYQQFEQTTGECRADQLAQLHSRLAESFPSVTLSFEYVVGGHGSLMTIATVAVDLSLSLEDLITLFGSFGFRYCELHQQRVTLKDQRRQTWAQQLKTRWDPQNLLNAGKLVPSGQSNE